MTIFDATYCAIDDMAEGQLFWAAGERRGHFRQVSRVDGRVWRDRVWHRATTQLFHDRLIEPTGQFDGEWKAYKLTAFGAAEHDKEAHRRRREEEQRLMVRAAKKAAFAEARRKIKDAAHFIQADLDAHAGHS